MNGKNNEGYRDPTAETAIRNVEREQRREEERRILSEIVPQEARPANERSLPKGVARMISVVRELLDINSYRIVSITLYDKRNRRTYTWEGDENA